MRRHMFPRGMEGVGPMSLQEALKLLRMELGLTQNDLAKKLNKAYVTVNRWENGKGFPSRGNAKTILEIARKGRASKECISYLGEVLQPDAKRVLPATAYGFPDIDRDFLFQLADGSTNAMYVIEAGTYRLLYTNRKAEAQAAKFLSEIGVPTSERKLMEQADKRCFHYFGNQDKPCDFCPLAAMEANGFQDVVIPVPKSGRRLHVHARPAEMQGRAVYAVYLTDVTQEDAERGALYALTDDIPAGVGIYHVYKDGRIELAFMNRAMFEMVGEERGKELMQNGPSKICLIHPKDRQVLMGELKNSIAESRPIDLTLRMKMRGGQYQRVRLEARLLRKGGERETYYCLFHRAEET